MVFLIAKMNIFRGALTSASNKNTANQARTPFTNFTVNVR